MNWRIFRIKLESIICLKIHKMIRTKFTQNARWQSLLFGRYLHNEYRDATDYALFLRSNRHWYGERIDKWWVHLNIGVGVNCIEIKDSVVICISLSPSIIVELPNSLCASFVTLKLHPKFVCARISAKYVQWGKKNFSYPMVALIWRRQMYSVCVCMSNVNRNRFRFLTFK